MKDVENVFSYLKRQLLAEEDSLVQSMVAGGVPDFAEYKHMCGRIRGLRCAQRLVDDAQQKAQREDD